MIKKKKGKLGTRAITKKKNPFLNPKGGLDLVEKFPGIDFIKYRDKKVKKLKEKR